MNDDINAYILSNCCDEYRIMHVGVPCISPIFHLVFLQQWGWAVGTIPWWVTWAVDQPQWTMEGSLHASARGADGDPVQMRSNQLALTWSSPRAWPRNKRSYTCVSVTELWGLLRCEHGAGLCLCGFSWTAASPTLSFRLRFEFWPLIAKFFRLVFHADM